VRDPSFIDRLPLAARTAMWSPGRSKLWTPPDSKTQRAEGPLLHRQVPEPGRSALARDIARTGSENFLYARYVLDDILNRQGVLDRRTATIETLPHGLEAVYHYFLARELAANDERWGERYRPVLGALPVSRDPA
jgi:hypothetical protein